MGGWVWVMLMTIRCLTNSHNSLPSLLLHTVLCFVCLCVYVCVYIYDKGCPKERVCVCVCVRQTNKRGQRAIDWRENKQTHYNTDMCGYESSPLNGESDNCFQSSRITHTRQTLKHKSLCQYVCVYVQAYFALACLLPPLLLHKHAPLHHTHTHTHTTTLLANTHTSCSSTISHIRDTHTPTHPHTHGQGRHVNTNPHLTKRRAPSPPPPPGSQQARTSVCVEHAHTHTHTHTAADEAAPDEQ